MRRLWWIHVGFIALYALLALSRLSHERVGHPVFTSLGVDLVISLPATLAVLVLGRSGRLSLPARLLLRWSLAELPAIVGIVGFLAGGQTPWLGWHLGLSLVLLVASSAPKP